MIKCLTLDILNYSSLQQARTLPGRTSKGRASNAWRTASDDYDEDEDDEGYDGMDEDVDMDEGEEGEEGMEDGDENGEVDEEEDNMPAPVSVVVLHA